MACGRAEHGARVRPCLRTDRSRWGTRRRCSSWPSGSSSGASCPSSALFSSCVCFGFCVPPAHRAPLGFARGLHEVGGQRLVRNILFTLYGLPPVLAGLLVFLLLSRGGPLRFLGLLFTPPRLAGPPVGGG